MLISSVMLLAARERELDTPQLILYGVLVLASVVGGILQKRKADSQKTDTAKRLPKPTPHRTVSRRTGQTTLSTPERQPDLLRRPPAQPVPPRPARPARVPVGAPGAPEPPPVVARPPAGRRAESVPRVAAGREAKVPEVSLELPRPAHTMEPRPFQTQLVTAHGTVDATRARVRAALRDRSQLQAAFVLSELLAPPVALRDPW